MNIQLKQLLLCGAMTLFGVMVLFGQNTTDRLASLEQQITDVPLIVEAEVISSEAFKQGEYIYTGHQLKVAKLLKGTLPQEDFQVLTDGGQVGNEGQLVTHTIQFGKGAKGVFFLVPHEIFPGSQKYYRVYDTPTGFLRFRFGRDFAGNYRLSELEQKITQIARQEPVDYSPSPPVSQAAEEVGVKYILRDFFFETDFISFDLYIRALGNPFYLAQTSLKMNHGGALGEISAATVQTTSAFGASRYGLTMTALGSDLMLVELRANQMNAQVTSIVSAQDQLVAHFRFPLSGVDLSGFDLEAELSDNLYLHPSGYLTLPINIVEYEVEVGIGAITPEITGISPSTITAGTDEVLTISGNNFGDFFSEGTTDVFFINADGNPTTMENLLVSPVVNAYQNCNGPIEIVCWSDDEIQVRVPTVGRSDDINIARSASTAASGPVTVKNIFGFFTSTSNWNIDDLKVKWSINNYLSSEAENPENTDFQYTLQNMNGQGGYSIKYSPNFQSNYPAIEEFEAALDTWRCVTGLNVIIDNNYSGDNGLITVGFGDFPSESTATGRTRTFWRLCESGGEISTAVVRKAEILFNNSSGLFQLPFDLAACGYFCFDFQSTALHELGHSLTIGHTLQEEDVMYTTAERGIEEHYLTSHDLEAAMYVYNRATQVDANCTGPMIRLPSSYCTNNTEELVENFPVTISPNPANHLLNLAFRTEMLPSAIYISDLLGRVSIKQMGDIHMNHQIDVNQLVPGLYVITMHYPNGTVYTLKFIKD